MSISAQLPPISLAAASPALRALAQAAGQTLEARVMGQLANGMTHIQLGQQNLAIALPTPQAPGTVLSLAIQQGQGQLRLSIVSARPPGTATAAAPASAPAPPAATPAATTVELSAAARTARDVALPPTVSAPAQSGAAAPAAGPRAPVVTVAPAPVAGASAATPTPVAASGPVAATVAAAPAALPAAAPAATASTSPPLAQAAPAPGGAALPAGVGGPAAPGLTAPAALPAAAPSAAPAAPAGGAAAPIVPGAAAPGAVRPVIPYAAALAVPNPGQAPAGNNAAVALPPVQQVAAATAAGQHDPFSARAGAPSAPAAPAAASPAAPTATSPQQALAQMVQQALPRQNTVLALTAALTTALGRVGLPEPVAKAAQQVLARQTVLDGKTDAQALRAAVRDSGVFHESLLAAGRPATAAGDMKAALLGLQRELGRWLGPQGAVERVSQLPPPLRGLTPRARSRETAIEPLPPDLREAGKVLQERTEHALGRLRLHQNASLPDGAPRADANWSMDLPVVIHGQPTLLQMQIQRDAEDDAARPEDRGWQVRFAVNMGDYGEVGAQISMRGKTTGILLWADDAETAAALNSALGELREDLAAAGLVSGALVVRAGAPLEDTQSPPRDHLVDEVR